MGNVLRMIKMLRANFCLALLKVYISGEEHKVHGESVGGLRRISELYGYSTGDPACRRVLAGSGSRWVCGEGP